VQVPAIAVILGVLGFALIALLEVLASAGR